MNIHVDLVSQCSGGLHRYIDVTIAGQSRTIIINRDDLALDPTDIEVIQNALIDRFRSALKEAGATLVLATWKTALEGKDFKI